MASEATCTTRATRSSATRTTSTAPAHLAAIGVRQHADCCLALVQLNGQARLVGIGQPQVLVVECAGRRAAEETNAQAHRAHKTENAPDSGALAGAVRADLVRLELAGGIEGQN